MSPTRARVGKVGPLTQPSEARHVKAMLTFIPTLTDIQNRLYRITEKAHLNPLMALAHTHASMVSRL